MGWSGGGLEDRSNWDRCLSLWGCWCRVGVDVGWRRQNSFCCVYVGFHVGIGMSGKEGGLTTMAVPIVCL